MTTSRKAILLVVLLLLCHFALRTYHIDVQQPYVDEGFHLRRAMVVWDFAENPGHFAHGKVLVYYWMGLFEATNTPLTILPVARLSIALFSVLTSAALYRVGCLLADKRTGLLAVALYAVMPLAFFYERMAMADPLAAGLMVLAAWRCIILAQRPTLAQGALVGLLLGLTTLAKLTMAGVVLLPFVAIALYGQLVPPDARKSTTSAILRYPLFWLRCYGLPLMLAALVGISLWLPMLIPAIAAHGTSEQFILVNDTNIAHDEAYAFKPLEYIQRLLPLLAEFISPALIIAFGLAVLIGGIGFYWLNRRIWRSNLFVLAWLVLLTAPALVIARLTTTRYFMPTTIPAVLLLALVVLGISRVKRVGGILHYGLLALFGVWLFVWTLPFMTQAFSNPHALPFTETNHTEYVAGYFLGDEAVQAAAAQLNSLPPRPIYATWNLCHLIFFYVEQPITCLPERTPRRTLEIILEPLSSAEKIYFVMADYEPFWMKIGNAKYEKIGEYTRALIKRPVYVLELSHKE